MLYESNKVIRDVNMTIYEIMNVRCPVINNNAGTYETSPTLDVLLKFEVTETDKVPVAVICDCYEQEKNSCSAAKRKCLYYEGWQSLKKEQ